MLTSVAPSPGPAQVCCVHGRRGRRTGALLEKTRQSKRGNKSVGKFGVGERAPHKTRTALSRPLPLVLFLPDKRPIGDRINFRGNLKQPFRRSNKCLPRCLDFFWRTDLSTLNNRLFDPAHVAFKSGYGLPEGLPCTSEPFMALRFSALA